MIVDASVAFKLIAEEEGSDQALALLRSENLFAPTLMLVEVGNALWKQVRRNQIDPDVSFETELVSLAMLVGIVDEAPYTPRALSIARSLDHPIYDCVYLAIAEIDGDRMVSADRRFLTKVRQSAWADFVEELA